MSTRIKDALMLTKVIKTITTLGVGGVILLVVSVFTGRRATGIVGICLVAPLLLTLVSISIASFFIERQK